MQLDRNGVFSRSNHLISLELYYHTVSLGPSIIHRHSICQAGSSSESCGLPVFLSSWKWHMGGSWVACVLLLYDISRSLSNPGDATPSRE